MAHPKNTTAQSTAQHLVSSTQGFLISGVSLQVNQGSGCYTTIDAASSILSSVNVLLGNLVSDAPDNGCEIYGIRVLTMQCEAMLDSVAVAVRNAEDLAPQNATSPVRGAEVTQ